MQKPNWLFWINLADVELSKAVALSCGIDPDHLDARPQYVQVQSPNYDQYRQRLRIAESYIVAGTLPHEQRGNYYDNCDCFVKLPAFRAWGESLPQPFTFPDEFPRPPAVVQCEPAAPPARAPSADEPLSTKERNNLLRIIAGLALEANIDLSDNKATVQVEAAAAKYNGPKEKTVRGIVDAIRKDILPDANPR